MGYNPWPLKSSGVPPIPSETMPLPYGSLDEWHRPIGLLGYAGAGKDWLARQLGEPFTRVSFADKVRELALRINPLVAGPMRLRGLVEAFGWDEAKKNPEVRRVLQEIGTGVRDLVGEDVWVNAADVIGHARRTPVVVTDVRFPNEARLIERLDGILVRILRPGVGPVNGHTSETKLDGWSTQLVAWNGSKPAPAGALPIYEILPLLRDLGQQKTHGRLR